MKCYERLLGVSAESLTDRSQGNLILNTVDCVNLNPLSRFLKAARYTYTISLHLSFFGLFVWFCESFWHGNHWIYCFQ